MPIRHTSAGWYWGSRGPFDSREKAVEVARAAYSHGYKDEDESLAERKRKAAKHKHKKEVK